VLHGIQQQSVSRLTACLPILGSVLPEESKVRAAARLTALVALETEQYPQALDLLVPGQSAWSRDPLASYRVVLVERLHSGRVEDLSRWRGLAPSQYFFYEAARYRTQGRHDRALVAAELAYVLDAGWSDEWSRALNAWIMGKSYHQAGQNTAAQHALEAALPGLITAGTPLGREYAAYAYRRLGEIAEQQGDRETAFEYYVQSILVSPQHANFFRLSDLMLAQGRSLQDVYAVFAQLCRRGPQDNPYLWANSAAVFRERGAPDLARRVLDQVPPELTSTPVIRGREAELAADRGDLQIASSIYRTLLEEARSQGDKSAIAHWANALAEVLSRQGDYAGAVSLFEEATWQMPSVAQYWFNLGQAYRQQGRVSEARAAFRKALALESGYTAAAQALAELEE